MGRAIGGIEPVYDTEIERVKDQLAYADALRKQGLSGDIGQGYQGGRIYIRGNGWGNALSGIAGALLGEKARRDQAGIEDRQNQAREEWLGQMPASESMQPVEQFGPPVPGEQMPSTPTMLPKSAKQYAQEMTSWGMKAPRGMEGVQQYALQQAMTAPEKEAARADAAAAREQELKMKAADRQEQREWQAGQNEMYRLTAAQQAEQADKRLGLMMAKITAAGGGKAGEEINQEAADFIAGRFLEGDQNALVGISRNKALHSAVMASIARQAQEQGINPKEAVQRGLEYKGSTAEQRTIGNQAANVSMASNEAYNMMPVVSDLSKKVPRTDFPTINAAGNIIRKQSGDPNVVAFDQSIDSLINAYARAINPKGVATVTDKKRAHERLNTAFSNGQVEGVLDVMRREIEASKAAPVEARATAREVRVGGGEPKPAGKVVDFNSLK